MQPPQNLPSVFSWDQVCVFTVKHLPTIHLSALCHSKVTHFVHPLCLEALETAVFGKGSVSARNRQRAYRLANVASLRQLPCSEAPWPSITVIRVRHETLAPIDAGLRRRLFDAADIQQLFEAQRLLQPPKTGTIVKMTAVVALSASRIPSTAPNNTLVSNARLSQLHGAFVPPLPKVGTVPAYRDWSTASTTHNICTANSTIRTVPP